uniref:Uncharacterized protein n=3 Tax=Aegilops tauschii TaxID=37682 RepID=A0A453MXP8_AEGTS
LGVKITQPDSPSHQQSPASTTVLSSVDPEEAIGCTRKEMEAKRSRAAAMAALCVLLFLLLLPRQAAAKSRSEYCECFDGCYLSCRNDHHNPRWDCIPSCQDSCTIFTSQAGGGAAPCYCETRACESSAAPADAPDAAVR